MRRWQGGNGSVEGQALSLADGGDDGDDDDGSGGNTDANTETL